jgi:hypothetical protein
VSGFVAQFDAVEIEFEFAEMGRGAHGTNEGQVNMPPSN